MVHANRLDDLYWQLAQINLSIAALERMQAIRAARQANAKIERASAVSSREAANRRVRIAA